ncbi:DUF2141 domain-containing protein [Aquisalimonas sp.]|uniref:DUF2141 domain-containing protein n=1 Tax=unclassified Aquisalimonas TaxID=2644645 RepID=UPI0025C50E5D|nr:DUF2141 domain-containing protein [Aquisalimonas sp.]
MTITTRTTIGLILGLGLTAAHATDLRVTVENVEPDTGHLMVALYDDEAAFDARDGAVEEIRKSVDGECVVLTFTGVSAGDYAIAAFQDLDGDGELNTNLVGMPREPWGFSRDASGGMGPPDFGDAAFTVDGDAVDMSIRLNRP